MLEQMSFIIPGESEQIALIEHMEAESVPATPFAFSVPQEDMDDILRTGGNTTNHRLILAAEFSKGKPVEEMARILQQVYHGGNGMATEHGRISAWYEENGIRFAPGVSARYTRIAQVMSWEDAAKRIGELLESGQYLSMMELAASPAHERAMIAQRLWNLYGDTTPDGKVFLSSLEPIRGGGFPDETARLAERLADPAFLSGITAEMNTFANAYMQNRNLLRFRFHNPAALARLLRELALPRREYESLLTEVSKPAAFITEDEIDAQLASGSSMAGGKGRIYRFFTAYPAHTPKEKADFLKGEYGIGGRSHAVSGSDRSGESHDGKGIKLEKEGCPPVQLSWAQVSKRIDALIARDRYMTPKELESIGALQEAEEVQSETNEAVSESDLADNVEANEDMQDDDEPIDTEAVRERLADAGIVNGEVVDEEALRNSPFIQQITKITEQIQAEQDSEEPPVQNAGEDSPESAEQEYPYRVGDTVYLDDRPFVITQIGHFNVQLRDPSLDYPIFRSESIERFAQLLAQDERNAALLSTIGGKHTPEADYPQLHPQGYPQSFPRDSPAPVSNSPSAVENFRITDDHLGEGGAKAKFGNNLAAIRTLKQIEAEGRTATPQEQEILSRYVGWGGLADAFDPDKPAWADEYRQLAAMLTSQEYEAARASTLNAHFTSPVVIRAMYDAVAQMGFTGGNILEPSMGVGNFFGMLPEGMQASRLYGVELDSITGRIAQQLYPKANITVAGFETTDRRDFFDLTIGNVPFGNYQVNDRAYNKLGFSIHNYFFAKAIDQVRPGGVIAFVTSRYTMDQQSPEVRKYIAQRAELLGAIRLPNNAFRANAGTEVVSDIIFLQKRDRAIEIEPDWVHVGENADGFTMNSYFVQHPEMVLGTLAKENTQYGRESFTVLPMEGVSLADQLHEAIGHIHGTYQEAALPDLGDDEAIDESIPADPDVRNFSYTVMDGTVYYRENSRMVKPHLNQTAQERVKGMIALRDQVRKLIDAQLDEHSDGEIEQLQQELNTLYDSFSARFGLINDRANRLAFSSDSSYYLLCSLEILDDDHKLLRKADMFTKRTIKQQRSVDHVDTSADALAVSIGERARVDLGYMAQLTGKSEEDIVQELTGVIFCIPGTDAQYVTADEYLSGNVRQKLREAKNAAEADAAFQPNVTALEAAQPKDLEASDIDVRLGATWIAPEYVQDFMYELLNTPYYQRRAIEVHFSPHTAEWRINGKNVVSRSNVAAYTTYGTDRANAYKILEDTLNLRDVRIYDTVQDADGREQRVLNQKATTLAQQKQQAIKDAFREWIWKDPERRQTLVTQYNELFNSVRPREYDGSHIVFAGMNPEISLREHQRNAVAHVLYGGNTLLAHQVGAGKTFEMVAAAMESKRLGLCQKSMFVVPNHLTEQWASEFLRLYPSANILVTTKKDFETGNRKKFCARIATGDYDAVIIGHSQFEKIPVSHERQEQLLQDEIAEIME
ncbi:MAG: DEAD/DEAH box helicase family protein, partial [Candidatus Ventricola sp.]